MSRAGKSIYYYGFFIVAGGLALMLLPRQLIGLSGLTISDLWPLRVLGSLFAFVGVYYVGSGWANLIPFIRLTVWGRVWFAATVVAFVVFGLAPWLLMLNAALDLITAGWTAFELRRSHIKLNPFATPRPALT